MKKPGSLLKSGVVVFIVMLCYSMAQAQTGAKFTGGTVLINQNTKEPGSATKFSTAKTLPALTDTINSVEQSKESIAPEFKNSTARKCTNTSSSKPYSITRENFNKLPINRQQFVLNNLNKYTIID